MYAAFVLRKSFLASSAFVAYQKKCYQEFNVPLTPKFVFAVWQNVNDLKIIKTKIWKIHEVLTLLWTFKVAMLSFPTVLWEIWVLASWWRRPGNRVFSSLVDLGDDFASQKLHVSPAYLLLVRNVMK